MYVDFHDTWVCMYLYMHVRMYVCTYVCITLTIHEYACMYTCMHVRMYVSMYVCMSVFMYVCMYVFMQAMHVCMYACMRVCLIRPQSQLYRGGYVRISEDKRKQEAAQHELSSSHPSRRIYMLVKKTEGKTEAQQLCLLSCRNTLSQTLRPLH